MQKLLVVVVALLGLGGALWWFATTAPGARGARPESAARPASPVSTEERPAEVTTAPAATESTPQESEPFPPTPTGPAAREASSSKAGELAQAHWVEGHVVIPEGTPADERLVVVARGKDFADGSDHRAPVAPDGSFRTAFHPQARTGHLALEARYLYLDRIVRWKRDEPSGPVVLEPKLGARIEGRLVVPARTDPGSIGGTLELHAQRQTGNRWSRDQFGRRDVTAELAFAFDGLVPGARAERTYELRYEGERFIGESGELVPEAGKTLAVELALRPGVTLSGVVRDAAGQPLAGVRVHSQSRQPSGVWTRSGFRSTTSAADGTFRLGAIVPGRIELQAQCEGLEAVRRELGELADGSGLSGLELVMGAGQSIAGVVRWPDGSPAEAHLTLVPRRKGFETHWLREVEGESAADGTFSIGGLSEEVYRITARATRVEEVPVASELTGRTRTKRHLEGWSAERQDVRAGTRDLLLTLSSGLTLDGSVVDDLGVPVTDFRIEAQRMESGLGSFLDDDELAQSFRDTDGTFRLEGFRPGEWSLRALSSAHGDSTATVTLPAREPLRLVLPREATLTGLVLDPSGSPVAGAQLELSVPAERSPPSRHEHDRFADGEGRFELDGLAPGITRLQASGAGFAPSEPVTFELTAGEPVAGVRLVLRRGGTILGEVVGSDGGPLAGQMVSVNATGYSARPATDARGRFEATAVPPGDVRVLAQLSEGIQLQERATVADGETVRVRLAVPAQVVRLHGRVLAGGERLPHANLNARNRQEEAETSRSARAVTDAEGAFELTVPGPGRYSISVSHRGETVLSWSTTLAVPAVESFAFDVSIPLGRISGRVTDARGAPLAAIEVSSRPEQHEDGSHGSARAVTDDEGRYELSVPAGRHAVKAGGNDGRGALGESSSFAEALVGGLVVGENGHLRNVDLRLERGGDLTGFVRAPDGSPASAILWRETRERWEPLAWGGEDGRFAVRGLAPGPLLLSVNSSQGATREPVRVEVRAGEPQHLEITLVPAAVVKLTVRQRGAPVGSEISVVDEHGTRLPVRGSGGEVQLGPLVAGRYTVRAQRDGKTIERAFEVTPGAPDLVLELVFE